MSSAGLSKFLEVHLIDLALAGHPLSWPCLEGLPCHTNLPSFNLFTLPHCWCLRKELKVDYIIKQISWQHSLNTN